MKFFIDLMGRDNKWSSKKVFYCIAGLVATICLLWITYRDTMEDWNYICLFSVYLVTVGGFEVMLKMMAMVLDFKSGRSVTTTTATFKEEAA